MHASYRDLWSTPKVVTGRDISRGNRALDETIECVKFASEGKRFVQFSLLSWLSSASTTRPKPNDFK
jgi:hypothetical protein